MAYGRDQPVASIGAVRPNWVVNAARIDRLRSVGAQGPRVCVAPVAVSSLRAVTARRIGRYGASVSEMLTTTVLVSPLESVARTVSAYDEVVS